MRTYTYTNIHTYTCISHAHALIVYGRIQIKGNSGFSVEAKTTI